MSKSLTHTLTLLTFVVSAFVAMASDKPNVRFPSKEVLRESLAKAGLDHFMEKTRIENIVDDQLVPFGVAVRLDIALYDYNENLKQGVQNAQRAGMMAMMMEMRRSEILEILLQADAAALEQLQVAGLYKPRT